MTKGVLIVITDLDISLVLNYILQACAVLGIVIEVTPIKFSPLGWLGKKINKPMIDKIERMESKVTTVKEDLQEHIVDDWRTYILDFQNSCLNKKKHTREEFTRVYKVCDKYEKYVETRKIINSEADQAISYIKRVYEECLEDGEFLLRGVDEN